MSRSDSQEIRIRGGQHHRMEEAVDNKWLEPRTELILIREPDNQFDSKAVVAFIKNPKEEMVKIGYVAGNQVGRIYWRLDRGAVIIRCTVLRLTKNAVDCHLELKGGWHEEDGVSSRTAPKPTIIPDDDIPF